MPSSFHCNSTNPCRSTSIECDSNFDCLIKCHGSTVCEYFDVNCPSGTYNCDIICDGKYACQYAKIDASQIIGGNLTIIAKGAVGAFRESYTTCPSQGNCIFEGTGNKNNLFQSNIINASHSHGTLLTRWRNDGSSGTADYIFKDTIIYCPSGPCIINSGISYQGLMDLHVVSQSTTTHLSISGDGGEVLKNAHIICPPMITSITCEIINTDPSYPNPIDSMVIDVVESFTNLNLISTWNGTSSFPAIIRCTEDYTSSCALNRLSSTSWECIDKASLCQSLESMSPTLEPTMNPSSNPTMEPTMILPGTRTINPTFSPFPTPSKPISAPSVSQSVQVRTTTTTPTLGATSLQTIAAKNGIDSMDVRNIFIIGSIILSTLICIMIVMCYGLYVILHQRDRIERIGSDSNGVQRNAVSMQVEVESSTVQVDCEYDPREPEVKTPIVGKLKMDIIPLPDDDEDAAMSSVSELYRDVPYAGQDIITTKECDDDLPKMPQEDVDNVVITYIDEDSEVDDDV